MYFGLPTVHNDLAEGIIKRNNKEVKVYGLLSRWARKPDYHYQTLEKIVYGENKVINPNSFDYENLSILNCIDLVYKN